jgi:hypothetical protein
MSLGLEAAALGKQLYLIAAALAHTEKYPHLP